eukprot:9547236-Lingulodinium_polyedra.AAC.1
MLVRLTLFIGDDLSEVYVAVDVGNVGGGVVYDDVDGRVDERAIDQDAKHGARVGIVDGVDDGG